MLTARCFWRFDMLGLSSRAVLIALSLALIVVNAGCDSADDMTADSGLPIDGEVPDDKDPGDDVPDDKDPDDGDPGDKDPGDGEDDPVDDRCDWATEYIDEAEEACVTRTLCDAGSVALAPAPRTSDHECAPCAPGDECLGGFTPKRRCGWLDHDADPSTPCTKIADLGMGAQYSCVLFDSGNVRCWGFNDQGTLRVPSDLGEVSALSVGYWHVCAIVEGDQVRCWGDNTSGKINVPSDLGPVQAVFARQNHSCALREDGELRCWGSNQFGETDLPPELGDLGVIIDYASAGMEGSCVLIEGGAVHCWGIQGFMNSLPADLPPARSLYGSSGAICAVLESGEGLCWGTNKPARFIQDVAPGFGPIRQLAISSGGLTAVNEANELVYVHTVQLPLPPGVSYEIPDDLGPAHLAAIGNWSQCVVLEDRETVRCFGAGVVGTLPDDLAPAKKIYTYAAVKCVIFEDDSARCWGSDWSGLTEAPSDLRDVVSLSIDSSSACAVIKDGTLRCWGSGYGGFADETGVIASDSSNAGRCVLIEDGTVKCIGFEWLEDPDVLAHISSLGPSLAISVENYYACVLLESGSFACWDENGIGSGPQISLPDGSEILGLRSSDTASCLLIADSPPYCWWDWMYPASFYPSAGADVREVALGIRSVCGIDVDGEAACWWPSTSSETWVEPPANLGPIRDLSIGSGYVCAVLESRAVRCWGRTDLHHGLDIPGPIVQY